MNNSIEHISDFSLPSRIRLSNTKSPKLLLFLLHSSYTDESSFEKWVQFIDPRITIVMPRALFPVNESSKKMMWFKASFTSSEPIINSTHAEESRIKLISYIKEVQNDFHLGGKDTVIAWFSQGGVLSASVALTEPRLVQGFSILSGRILPEINECIDPVRDLCHLRALVCHGTMDELLSVQWAKKSKDTLSNLGIDTSFILDQYKHELIQNTISHLNHWLIKYFGNLPAG
jgi:phospholipase/carboxylesterase